MTRKRLSREEFQRRQQEILQVRAAVVHEFPNCFVPKGAPKRPLKIGIVKDLLAAGREAFPDLSVRLIKAFLTDYCGGPNYHKAMVKGAVRVDLNGSFAGIVDDSAARFARDRIASINGELAARKARRALTRLTPLQRKRADLERLERAQFAAERSDNFYFSSGRKAKDDAEIRKVRAELAELEAGSKLVAA